MKKLYIILIALAIAKSTNSQTNQPCSSCLPEGIIFTEQSQIDSFQIKYPDCSQLEGYLYINDVYQNINNLNGLSTLTSIAGILLIHSGGFTSLDGLNNLTSVGSLMISTDYNFISLSGLENLITIDSMLMISSIALTDLMGLVSLTSVGGEVFLVSNFSLTNLTGLNNLTTIGGYFSIDENDSLTSLTGLENLTSIGGFLNIGSNNALTSLTGLENLTSIGGSVSIGYNDALLSLSGLDKVSPGSITSLSISSNSSLAICDAEGICEYLASQGAVISIHDNATGCNSKEEVEAKCRFGLNENANFPIQVYFYPNPTSTEITIETPIAPDMNTFMTIHNINGQVLLSHQIKEQQTVVDVSGLSQGIYFVRICNNRTVQVGKFVKQ